MPTQSRGHGTQRGALPRSRSVAATPAAKPENSKLAGSGTGYGVNVMTFGKLCAVLGMKLSMNAPVAKLNRLISLLNSDAK
jgi:hypothetical protein